MNLCRSLVVLLGLLVATTLAANAWHYDQAGADWVDDGYPLCGGSKQSPIDLSSVTPGKDLQPFTFSWGDATSFRVLNNGHTIQIDTYDISPTFTDPNTGILYDLKQFHFHSASEHMWGSSYRDMEVHLVHIKHGMDIGAITSGNDLLVIGVSFQATKLGNNDFLNTFWSQLTSVATANTNVVVSSRQLDFASAMPPTRDYFAYSGSLTTPACYEGVTWYVFDQPVSLSEKQLDSLRTTLGLVVSPTDFAPDGNRRAVQPLNGRTVLRYRDAAPTNAPEAKTKRIAIASIVISSVAFVALVAVTIVVILTKLSAAAAAVSPSEPTEMKPSTGNRLGE